MHRGDPPDSSTLSRDVLKGRWICPTCREECGTHFCGRCGEKRLDQRDLTVAGLVGHALESLTNVDGRVFRSIRDLVMRPGALTAAYMRGQRRPYVAPFQMFLVTNVLFFVLQSALGFQVLSNDLGSHIGTWTGSRQYYSAIARPIAERRLAATGRTIEQYTDVFNQAVRVNAKGLVVAMVPLVGLVLLAAFPRGRYPVATAIVLALHFLAFFLLLETLAMPLLGVPAGMLLSALSLGWLWDPLTSTVLIAICAAWIYKASRAVYGASAKSAALKAAAIAGLFIPVIICYRFIVFLVTLFTT
jgi:hypothetical protein